MRKAGLEAAINAWSTPSLEVVLTPGYYPVGLSSRFIFGQLTDNHVNLTIRAAQTGTVLPRGVCGG